MLLQCHQLRHAAIRRGGIRLDLKLKLPTTVVRSHNNMCSGVSTA
jgi:hypothetical protein